MGLGKQELSKLNETNYYLICINYILNVYEIVNEDIDVYYYQLIEKALEYGMSIDEFWNSDIEYYYCYENAYFSKIHNLAHTQGLYNFEALTLVAGNIFAKNKGEIKQYPTENFYMSYIKEQNKKQNEMIKNPNHKEKLSIKKITKENLEEQYRLRLLQCY